VRTDAGLPVQRAPHPHSDTSLRLVYEEMLARSATFQEIDNHVSPPERPLRLADSALSDGITNYNPAGHVISTPGIRMPLPQVRANLIFEMHNAFHRDAFAHIRRHMEPRLGEGDLLPYFIAARALAFEWIEWCVGATTEIRALQVNFEMGNPERADAWRQALDDDLGVVNDRNVGGSGVDLHQHVTNEMLDRYDLELEGSWRSFTSYIQEQIATHHTQGYDPAAGTMEWAGTPLVEAVIAERPRALMMSQGDVRKVLGGEQMVVKNSQDNPFNSKSLVRRVGAAAE
jgi:hypothetical protein